VLWFSAGWLLVTRFAGGDAFDDASGESLLGFDVEPVRAKRVEWSSAEVFALHRHRH
jgi:hypothetical protein